ARLGPRPRDRRRDHRRAEGGAGAAGMKSPVERAAIALYDRFTHEGMDRRAFMAELTRIAGGAAAASALLGSIACHAAALPQVAADDRRIRTRPLEWEPRPGRHYRGYNAAPADGADNLPLILVV